MAGAVGVAALLLLALLSKSHWAQTLLATGVVAVATVILASRATTAAEAEIARNRAPPDGGADRASQLLALLPDPVMLVSRAERAGPYGARLVFANKAAREWFQLLRDGAALTAAIRHPAALQAVESALQGASVEIEIGFGVAQDRVWRLIARPAGSADGENFALVMLHDLTAARQAERKRVDFLANASHELRTPLASLTGFIETLRGPAREDEAAREKFLAIMSGQADRMKRLVEDLLSLSRIELNEHVPPSGDIDLVATVRDVLDGLGPVPAEGRAKIELTLPEPGAAVVRGDRDQLVQVAQNLVDNALKYAGPKGLVTVEVLSGVSALEAEAHRDAKAARISLLTPDAGDERYAVLRVTDNGPGVPRDSLTRLAERFYRAPGQKSGERSGTGLGLAIVKHILNRHKGGLVVESREGAGATFTAYAPMAAVTKTS
ncbi:MAG: sensor histidine kinase [Caulobacteraceae bacterium]